MKHAKLAPSSADKVAICSEYVPNNDKDPHPVTVEGTRCHDAMEKGDWSQLSAELQDHCQWCDDYCQAVMEANPATEESPGDLKLETKIKTPLKDCWGTVDWVYVIGDTAHIIDYKFGYNEYPSPADALQAKIYAWGLVYQFPALREVSFTYLQPRLRSVKTVTWTVEELLEDIQAEIESVYYRQGKGFRHREEGLCEYCATVGDCPLWKSTALEVAKRQDFEVPEELDWHLMTNEDWGQVLQLTKVLREFCDQANKKAFNRYVTIGELPDGYTLFERSKGWKVTDFPAFLNICDEWGLTEEDLAPAVTISVPKVTEAIKANAERGKKKLAGTQFMSEVTKANIIESKGTTQFMTRERNK